MKTKKLDPFLMELMSEINKTAETPKPGYKTIREWATIWSFKPSRTLEIINKGIKLGKVDKKIYRVLTLNKKRIAPTPHYCIKKKT